MLIKVVQFQLKKDFDLHDIRIQILTFDTLSIFYVQYLNLSSFIIKSVQSSYFELLRVNKENDKFQHEQGSLLVNVNEAIAMTCVKDVVQVLDILRYVGTMVHT